MLIVTRGNLQGEDLTTLKIFFVKIVEKPAKMTQRDQNQKSNQIKVATNYDELADKSDPILDETQN